MKSPYKNRKQMIARSFGRAKAYDDHAVAQRAVATGLTFSLAEILRDQGADFATAAPRILEIGCGTGFVTAETLALLPHCEILATDLSLEMVMRCREKTGPRPNVRYAVLDGEFPAVREKFDFIISGMTFQWFDDLPQGMNMLADCLKPGGVMLFTLPGRGTFHEWLDSLAALGLPNGGLPLPSASDILRSAPAGYRIAITGRDVTQNHPSALSFLRSIKSIGAGNPGPDYVPLSPDDLRRAMTRMERDYNPSNKTGVQVTYKILTAVATPTSSC